MIHGPCGNLNSQNPCMIDEKCSKYYYHYEFVTITTINKYEYRRRDNGCTIIKGNHILDNRWIVPHNPYLCQKYNCHINVKICSSIHSVKYLYNYIYKGHDCIIISIKDSYNEIEKYLNARMYLHLKHVEDYLILVYKKDLIKLKDFQFIYQINN
jgi:hypothetical protein